MKQRGSEPNFTTMITQTQYPDDTAFAEATITEVKLETKGWSVLLDDGLGFFVAAESPVEPKPGMVARFYGKGIGFSVRGLLVDGVKVFYRTEDEEHQHQLVTSYGADAADWLKRWDSGEGVWSIEMGGLGPGYEQAIQITVAEVLRIMIAGAFDASRWMHSEQWKADREKIEEEGFKNDTIERMGLSGAQWGAALNLAARLYANGPITVLTDKRIEDRKIQVSKSFPQG